MSDEIIKMYRDEGMTTVEIARAIGCSNSGVGRLLRRHGIDRIHTPNELRLSSLQISDICKRYIDGNETTIEIAKDYNVCDASIAKVLRENGVIIRKAARRSNIKNHDYFEVIDSPDKAYFLGWMITDGSVVDHGTRPGRADTISLEIHNKDRYILERFADCLGASIDVVKDETKRNNCYIRFSSEKMSLDLSKYGVVPRKTWIQYLPELSDALMPHLLRGVFDGNGTITIDKHGYHHIGFYGSEALCTQITDLLSDKLNLRKSKVSKSTCYHAWYGSKEAEKKIFHYMYDDCGDLFLQRKYAKFSYAN